MKEKVTPVFVTGTPDSHISSFAFEVVGDDNSPKKYPLYVLFSLKRSGDRDINLVSKSILFEVKHKFFVSESGVFESLKSSAEFVRQEFSEYEISMVLGYEEDGVIFVVAFGGSSVALFREGSYVRLLSSVQGLTPATGYSKDGDIIVLMTKGFSNGIPENDLVSILRTHEKNYLEELISRIIHKDSNSADKGAVFMSFGKGLMQSELKYDSTEKGKLRGLFGSKKINLRLKSDLEYLDQSQIVKARRRTMIIGILMILFVLIIGIYGSYRKTEKDKIGKYEPQLLEANQYLVDARGNFQENPDIAREMFAKAKEISIDLSSQGIEDERIGLLSDEINSLEAEILGRYKNNPKVFLDLNLLSESFVGVDIHTSNEVMVILDRENEKIITTNFEGKESRAVAGPSLLDNPTQVGLYIKRIFVLENDGIHEISSNKEKVVAKEWEENVLFGVYGGNLYLLDKQKSVVLRFTPKSDGYSESSEWTKNNDIDFGNISDIAIDGFIWALSDNGKVYKYSQGVRQNYSILGLSPQFSFPTKIFTDEEVESIYVLDQVNSRVVVLSKLGSFIAQYESELLSGAVDFSVSELEKKIVFLVKDKLYEIELGHLK